MNLILPEIEKEENEAAEKDIKINSELSYEAN
jgi:hypothetical protein